MGILGNSKMKLFSGSQKVKKAYLGTEKIYSAGNIVTYYVDRDEWYMEEVDSDASCLNPTTFTPSKSGWTFVGWRSDTTASDSVWTSKVMGDEPISLFAVFSKTCTLTAKSYDNTQTVDGNAYYNNGNTTTATVYVPTGETYSGWTWRGWSSWWDGNTSANASVQFSNGQHIDIGEDDRTIYGLYSQTVTQEFRSNYSVQTEDGTRYYNAYGNTLNASITVPNGASMSGWSWRGWAAAGVTTGNASVAYSNGATISNLTSSNTYYGLYSQTIYLYYNGNGASSGSVSTQSDTRYYNEGSGNSGVINPTFTLKSNGFSRTDYSFTGWDLGAVGATVTLSSSTTAYAQWKILALDVFNNGAYLGGVTAFAGCYAFPNVDGKHRDPLIPTVTNGSTIVAVFNPDGRKGSVLTNNAVNLTEWNYITITGSATSQYGTNGAWVSKSNTGTAIDGYENIVTDCKTFAFNTKTDISSLSGSYYLGAYMASGSNDNDTGTLRITRIRLEK